MEMSYTPSSNYAADEDADTSGGRKKKSGYNGMTMERGSDIREVEEVAENDRKGRSKRRQGVRSGSKSAFRKIGG